MKPSKPKTITLDEYLETLSPEARDAIEARFQELKREYETTPRLVKTFDENHEQRKACWASRFRVPTKRKPRKLKHG